MLLILLSWLYITFISINTGVLFSRLIKVAQPGFAVTSLLGVFFSTLLASFWAIFKNIGLEFHILLLVVAALSGYVFRVDVWSIYKRLATNFRGLSTAFKVLSVINVFLIIAQCAASPYVIDNESYYIQSVKWLNEYGFTKGLGNLHFFLAQMSGWHITQSVFSFSFLYDRFNDISGYCLLLANIFCALRLNDGVSNKNFNNVVIGMLPFTNVFFFQFISAPSPDVPVYIFTFIVISYYLTAKNIQDDFKLICVLLIFTIFIKTTAVTLLLIPIVLLFNKKVYSMSTFLPILTVGLITLTVFVIKNTITSGYPLFPVVNISYDANWVIPKEIAQLYYDETKVYGYLLHKHQFDAMTNTQLLWRWLTLPKLHGLFNVLGSIILIIAPIGIYFFNNKRKWWILYAVMVLQMVVLFISSPQYRFFMNMLLLFAFFFAAALFKKQRVITILFGISVAVTAYVVFMPIDLNNFSENKFALETSNFKASEIITPHANSRFNTDFEVIEEGNLHYNSPVYNEFLWASGNGPVPCINKKQVKRFKRLYNVVPQMREESLGAGFYSKRLDNEDEDTYSGN